MKIPSAESFTQHAKCYLKIYLKCVTNWKISKDSLILSLDTLFCTGVSPNTNY